MIERGSAARRASRACGDPRYRPLNLKPQNTCVGATMRRRRPVVETRADLSVRDRNSNYFLFFF